MTPPPATDIRGLLDRYERPLVRYAQSIVGDLESARDVVQDAFIRYARIISGEVGGDDAMQPARTTNEAETVSEVALDPSDTRHVEAWLFTVTRNRALDHVRKYSRIIPMPMPEERMSASLSLVTGGQYLGTTLGPALGAALVVFFGFRGSMLLGAALVGVGYGPVYPTLVSTAIARFPHAARSVSSMVTSAGSIGAITMPALTGIIIAQPAGLSIAWGGQLAMIGVMLVLLLGMRRTLLAAAE